MKQKPISEMTDDELRRRSLELAEKEHRILERRAKIRIICLILMALCVVWILVCCHQMGEGLDTTL